MARELAMPKLSDSNEESVVLRWLKSEGEAFVRGEPLLEVETDKAIVDIPSPRAGKIVRTFGEPGDLLKVGDPLVEFADEAGREADAGTVVGRVETSAKVTREKTTIAGRTSAAAVKATPAVRALARKLNVDLAMVTPTGADGLITANDVQRAAKVLAESGPIEILRSVRRVMAQNMELANAEVASATIMDDADIDVWPEGTHVMLRLIRALVAGCRGVKSVNAWYDSEKIGRWMKTYVRVVAVQGTMQVAIIVVMARFATGF